MRLNGLKLAVLGGSLLGTVAFPAEEFLQHLDEALSVSTTDAEVRAHISGALDLEVYHVPQPAPALIRTNGHELFTPRLSLFVDAQVGPTIYFFSQARVDRGFD